MMRAVLMIFAALVLGCGGAQTNAEEPARAQTPHALGGTPRPLSTEAQTPSRAESGGRMSNGEVSAYTQGFVFGCERECTRTSSAEVCSAYCTCMSQRITTEGRMNHVDTIALQGGDALMRDPWFQSAFSMCGSDLHDASFLQGCTSNCPGNCAPYCQCALDQMRRGMTREEGTFWFLRHVDLDVTLEGQQSINNAIQACMPLRPTQ